MTTWTIYLRNAQYDRVGEIDDYQSLEAIRRFNAVGSFSLDVDIRVPLVKSMLVPGMGIQVVRDNDTIFSGPILTRTRKRDEKMNRLTVSGVDDNVWLVRRVAHPEPLTGGPPYSSQAYDVRTGVASTIMRQYVNVNAGSSAVILRRVSGLVLGVDPLLGTSVTGRARWQPLIELLTELAYSSGGLGFQIEQLGSVLTFSIYKPLDKVSLIQFSIDVGTLLKHEYEVQAPEVTFLFVGGSGEGTARTIKEATNINGLNTWGRIESFQDRRDTAVDSELSEAAIKTFEEKSEKTDISIEPIEVPGQQYKTHYTLGDKVSVIVDGTVIQELIREVRVVLTPNGPQKVIPKVGSPGRLGIIALFDRLRDNERRLTDLERRR